MRSGRPFLAETQSEDAETGRTVPVLQNRERWRAGFANRPPVPGSSDNCPHGEYAVATQVGSSSVPKSAAGAKEPEPTAQAVGYRPSYDRAPKGRHNPFR